MSNIQKVEVVKPYRRLELRTEMIFAFIAMLLRTLFVWWAVAAWFPELGITYWQAILPVMALRMMFNNPSYKGRPVFWKKVLRERYANISGTKEFEELSEIADAK